MFTLSKEIFNILKIKLSLTVHLKDIIVNHKEGFEHNDSKLIDYSLDGINKYMEEISKLDNKINRFIDKFMSTHKKTSLNINKLIEASPLETREEYKETIQELEKNIRECSILINENKKMINKSMKNIDVEFDSINTSRMLTKKYNLYATQRPFSFYIDKKK